MNDNDSVRMLGRWWDGRRSDASEEHMLRRELQQLLTSLDPLRRRIIELSIQNVSTEQIADIVKRSTRTVRREVHRARIELEERLSLSDNEPLD